MTSSTGSRRRSAVRRIALDSALLGAAMMLSYVEAIAPISLIVPLPGVKPGFANLAVMTAFFAVGIPDAAAISAARVLLCGLLFGSPISTLMAAAGAVCAFAGLLIYRLLLTRALSLVGASILSAALHVAGQLAAASFIISDISVFAYAPVMLASSVATGAVNGVIAALVIERLNKERRKHD